MSLSNGRCFVRYRGHGSLEQLPGSEHAVKGSQEPGKGVCPNGNC